jgi:hypothetical protein
LLPVIFRSTDIPHFVSFKVYRDKGYDYLSVELKNSISEKLKEVIDNGILVRIRYSLKQIKIENREKKVVKEKIIIKGMVYDHLKKKYKLFMSNEEIEFKDFLTCKKHWSILRRIPFSKEKIKKGEDYFYNITAQLLEVKTISNIKIDLMRYWASQIPRINCKVIRR